VGVDLQTITSPVLRRVFRRHAPQGLAEHANRPAEPLERQFVSQIGPRPGNPRAQCRRTGLGVGQRVAVHGRQRRWNLERQAGASAPGSCWPAAWVSANMAPPR